MIGNFFLTIKLSILWLVDPSCAWVKVIHFLVLLIIIFYFEDRVDGSINKVLKFKPEHKIIASLALPVELINFLFEVLYFLSEINRLIRVHVSDIIKFLKLRKF